MAKNQTKTPENDSSKPDDNGAPPAKGYSGTTPPTTTSAPPAPPAADKEAQEAARIAAQKEELARKKAAEKEDAANALGAKVSGLEKHVGELKKENAALLKRAEQAEKERDTFRGKLQQEKVGTVDLQPGQAQLTESMTIISTEGNRVDAHLGDVLVVGSKDDARKAQKVVGDLHRVYGVNKAQFDEVAELGFSTVKL